MFFFWERWLLEVSMANSRHLFITHFRDHRRKNEVTEVDQALSTQRRTSEPLKQGVWYSMICEMIIRMWWYVVYTCLHLFFEDSLNCYQLGSIYMYRRKFRSQLPTIWTDGKAKSEKSRRERVRRKKMEMREKVGKSRFTVFFQWFVAPEGRKVGSLKRRVRSHVGRWEMKNCTLLWREAHFEVKTYKTRQRRSTFGSCDAEILHAGVARSTFPSQNSKYAMFGALLEVAMSKSCMPVWREAHFQVKIQNTPCLEHFWKLRCRKSARRCGVKHVSKQKCTKHTNVGALLEDDMFKKCTPLWRKAHQKTGGYRALLDVQMSLRVASARDCAHCQKRAKREGFLACPTTMAGVGLLKRIWKDAFSMAGAVCSSEMLGGPGGDFLRGVTFWSIRFSVLRGKNCGTGAALCITWHHFFVAGAILQRHGLEKKRKTHWYEAVSPAQLSIIEGSLAELLCFWCCQLE